MTEHAVVIVGGGPTGLMLAGELALAGVDAVALERRPDPVLAGSRAGGLLARTLEVLDQRGIAGRFLAEGQRAGATGFGGAPLDLRDLPTRHPYTLGLWQNHIERLLGAWAAERGATVRYGAEVAGLAQDDDGVTVELADGRALRALYLVGCDGGRSRVRKAAGIAFPGVGPTTSNLIAEAEVAEPPELGMRRDDRGAYGIGRVDYEIVGGEIVYADAGPVRIMLHEDAPDHADAPTLADLRAGLVAAYGTDFGVHSPTWISRFTDAARQAAAYRAGRVLLAGDAAHVHSPVGGQGLNTGVQDAVNLGWKLAQVVRGTSPPALLDTYHRERHPVGARVLRNTMALTALMRTDARTAALRDVVAELLQTDEARRRTAAMMAGLDLHYDLGEGHPGEGHPLLGRRVPDLDLVTPDGPTRVSTLLHPARPVLLHFGEGAVFDVGPWADRVRRVGAATADGAPTWDLPALGAVPAPPAVLIRPDGYVAWAGGPGLDDALTTWFGPPRVA